MTFNIVKQAIVKGPRTGETGRPDKGGPVRILPNAANELRCACGALVARVRPGSVLKDGTGGLEIKCRRCGQILLVPVAAAEVPPKAEGL